jgi:hypothetical protein
MNDVISLHNIINYLLPNNVITKPLQNNDVSNIDNKNNKPNVNNILNTIPNVITHYTMLPLNDTQIYDFFPEIVKKILVSGYYRYGIKTTMQGQMHPINISFLNSINFLIHSTTINNIDEQFILYNKLENLICYKINKAFTAKGKSGRNKKMDTKNIQQRQTNTIVNEPNNGTKNIQHPQINTTINVPNNNDNNQPVIDTAKIKLRKKSNKKIAESLIKKIKDGKIDDDVIQFIVNLFQINLLIFKFNDKTIDFFGPFIEYFDYLNPLRPLFLLSYCDNVYEPILISGDKNNNIIYNNIFVNHKLINFHCPKKIHIVFIEMFNNLDSKDFMNIYKTFFMYMHTDDLIYKKI